MRSRNSTLFMVYKFLTCRGVLCDTWMDCKTSDFDDHFPNTTKLCVARSAHAPLKIKGGVHGERSMVNVSKFFYCRDERNVNL